MKSLPAVAASITALVLAACCEGQEPPLPPTRPSWPVNDTIAEWLTGAGCLARDWTLHVESYSRHEVYGITMRADPESGPIRATTIWTGDMGADRDLFRRVLLHELVHVHAPYDSEDHEDAGIMAAHIEEGELNSEHFMRARAWCYLNPESVTFYGKP